MYEQETFKRGRGSNGKGALQKSSGNVSSSPHPAERDSLPLLAYLTTYPRQSPRYSHDTPTIRPSKSGLSPG